MELSKRISGEAYWADRMGTWTSLLCVVHCLVTPVLLSMSAVMAHLLPGEERMHRTLAVVVAAFGGVALVHGCRRHRRARVLVLMATGMGLIFGAAWLGDCLPAHGYEVAVTFAGSGLMITAHRWNHTFCRDCRCGDDRCGAD